MRFFNRVIQRFSERNLDKKLKRRGFKKVFSTDNFGEIMQGLLKAHNPNICVDIASLGPNANEFYIGSGKLCEDDKKFVVYHRIPSYNYPKKQKPNPKP